MLKSKVVKNCWGNYGPGLPVLTKFFQKDSCPTQKFFGNLSYAGFQKEAAKKYQQKEGRRIEDPRPD